MAAPKCHVVVSVLAVFSLLCCPGACLGMIAGGAGLGTHFELGMVWYDCKLDSRSKDKLKGSVSNLGGGYTIPYVPSLSLGLNYSIIEIDAGVFVVPPADAKLEILGAEINFLYPLSTVLDFFLKVEQSIKSKGSLRYEAPAELVELSISRSQLEVGIKYRIVPISKLLLGLAAARGSFGERDGAGLQGFNSRSIVAGFEFLY